MAGKEVRLRWHGLPRKDSLTVLYISAECIYPSRKTEVFVSGWEEEPSFAETKNEGDSIMAKYLKSVMSSKFRMALLLLLLLFLQAYAISISDVTMKERTLPQELRTH